MADRKFPKGTPKRCNGGRPFRAEVRYCPCLRCCLVRSRAIRLTGVHSDHPGAVITRAVTENA